MNLYNRLKDLREDMDKNQTQIAEIIGTSQSYYAQYENGKRALPFDRVIELAKYYNVSLDYIAGRTNDKRGLSQSEMSEEETLLIKNFRSLSESGKGKILERMAVIIEDEAEESASIKDVG